MKRSEVNAHMREADAFIRLFGHVLPPFAHWSTPEFQARKGTRAAEKSGASWCPPVPNCSARLG